MAKAFGLSKKERLKSRTQIEFLFEKGKSITVFPIRVNFLFLEAEKPHQALIGVTASKRYFKKAVDRNRIKRLLREAYRLQKKELNEALGKAGKNALVFFMYTDKSLPTFELVTSAMDSCLKRLVQKLHVAGENLS